MALAAAPVPWSPPRLMRRCAHMLPMALQVMEMLSRISCESYRNIVHSNPLFIRYFKHATPEEELGNLNIGGCSEWEKGERRCQKRNIVSEESCSWTKGHLGM